MSMLFAPRQELEAIRTENPIVLIPAFPEEYVTKGFYDDADIAYYDVVLKDKAAGCFSHIGTTGMLYWEDNKKELYNPTLEQDYRGRGLGTALYLAATALEISEVRTTLISSRILMQPCAVQVWQSLERNGYAQSLPTDSIDTYPRFQMLD